MNRKDIEIVLHGLIEVLASIEHERWSHWQKYMHGKGIKQPDGSLLMPADLVKRWERQFKSDYRSLPDDEKESDREQVRKYLPVIADALSKQLH
jgi:hypothetical protein